MSPYILFTRGFYIWPHLSWDTSWTPRRMWSLKNGNKMQCYAHLSRCQDSWAPSLPIILILAINYGRHLLHLSRPSHTHTRNCEQCFRKRYGNMFLILVYLEYHLSVDYSHPPTESDSLSTRNDCGDYLVHRIYHHTYPMTLGYRTRIYITLGSCREALSHRKKIGRRVLWDWWSYEYLGYPSFFSSTLPEPQVRKYIVLSSIVAHIFPWKKVK